MTNLLTISFTSLARIVIGSVILITLFSEQRWTQSDDVIKSDIRGYYTYLPALFIYDDISLSEPGKYPEEIWFVNEPDKNRYIKYSCGPALFYAPFFLVAHQLAEPLGYEANGYTTPYRFSLVMSSFVFLMLALLYLSKFLRLHFSDKTTAVVLFIVFLGTNVWTYSVNQVAFPHVYSLALVPMFFYFGSKWLANASLKRSIFVGFIAGLMVLTRPVDGIFLLFFIVYGISTKGEFISRLKFIQSKIGKVLMMILFFVVAMSPQFIYYKVVLGQFFYFSYREEGFFFTSPHLFDTLLNFRNGYLIYSPLMALSFAGFFFLHKSRRVLLFAISGFAIYFYVISSWWCWWYVGFGNRAFINVVPILVLPLGALIEWILSKRWFHSVILVLIVSGGIALNIFQAKLHEIGVVHWDGMTKEAYVYSFKSLSNNADLAFKINYPIYDSAMVGKDYIRKKELKILRSLEQDFAESAILPEMYSVNPQGIHYKIENGIVGIPSGIEYVFNQQINVEGCSHLRFSAWIKGKGEHSLVAASVDHKQFYFASSRCEERRGDWKLQELIVDLSNYNSVSSKTKDFNVYIWNHSLQPLVIDYLKIDVGVSEMSEAIPYDSAPF